MSKHYFNFVVLMIVLLIFPVAVFAAWRDAPAASPNYGAVTPDTQADYKPMNLGSTDQTKSGGARFAADPGSFFLVGSEMVGGFPFNGGGKLAVAEDSAGNPAFYVKQQQSSGYAVYSSGGMNYFGGNVGVSQSSPGAKLTINNPITAGKAGSAGDAVYAYANSSNAAVSAEQGNSAGYAVYASGKSAFMDGNIGIGTTVPSQKLDVSGIAIFDNATHSAGNGLRIVAPIADTHYNWMIGAQQNIDSGLEFTPSTAVGGAIFSTPVMTLLRGGNVGIGTTAPGASYKLDVAGTVNVSQLCFAGGNCQSSWSGPNSALIVENRISDPVSPETGRVWLIAP